ncbi:hypothetical protein D3C85_1257640 [compost metagenome]
MGVGQVHRLAVRAETQAVGHDEAAQLRSERPALPGAVAIKRTVSSIGAHVQHHAAGPETPLAVAATIVQAHVGASVINVCEQVAVEAAIAMRVQMKEPAFHSRDPATVTVPGDAREHLRRLPGVDMPGFGAPALQAAGGNIDPVQGVFLGDPDRALTDGVPGIDNQFSLHGNSFPWVFVVGSSGKRWMFQSPNGPAAQNPPPW